jgi:hypothetical protein
MAFVEQIEGAPKNGDLIILQDARWQALGRWAPEANGWVHPDGTPVPFSPTHWKPLDASLPDDETEQTRNRPFTRLILALVAASCIVGFVFWIGSERSSSVNSAANLEREFSRERDQASVAIGAFTTAREPDNIALTEAAESKQVANSKQKELKEELDKSEARSAALARELAETKQLADARQMELKEALDESEKTVLALARELIARDTIASAEKRSNAEVPTRDAASPTGSLDRSVEGSNAASGITGSRPTPQSRSNVTAGLQTSSDATPDDATAAASGQLTRSNRSQPDRPQPPRAMSPAEEAKLVARAESLIKQFDFASARLLLAHALEKGSARAAFMMAETYDWQILRSLQAYGVRGDAQRAREFYQIAAAAGIEKARERAEALQSDANLDTRVGGGDRSR